MTDLRYPIGEFTLPGEVSREERERCIASLSRAPGLLRRAVADLTEEQLDTPYRPEGWTVRQVVHHLADSHLNAYMRFKLALTEEEPTIRPYDEVKWAELADSEAPVVVSLELLESLHRRWVILWKATPSSAWSRGLIHPELGTRMRVDELLSMYRWHGEHHVAHITELRNREDW